MAIPLFIYQLFLLNCSRFDFSEHIHLKYTDS